MRGVIAALTLGLALLAGPSLADQVARDSLEGSPPPAAKHPKISSTLLDGLSAVRPTRRTPDAVSGVVADGGVQVYLSLTGYDPAVLESLARLDVRVEIVDPASKLIQARIPSALLEEVARLPFVRTIRPPDRPSPNAGTRQTQGDEAVRAHLARAQLGVNGSGVRVGVIQIGFEGLADSQASGDLPADVTLSTTRADGKIAGDSAEGTAMLEIIHDVAPGARLFGVSFSTSLEMIAAVNWLSDVAGGPNPRRGTPGGVDVIVDDISFFNLGPYDGSSALSRALTAAVDRGVVYFTSAGNRADQHWRGPFSACPGRVYQNFNAPACGPETTDETLNIRVVANGTFCAFLQWNDTWGASSNDYDLRLVDRDTRAFLSASDGVSGGRDAQTGTQDPAETMCFTDEAGAARHLGIVIENFQGSAQPRQLELFLTGDGVQLEHVVSDHSIPNVGDAKKVLAVGAVHWRTPDQIESYSSRGPTLDGRLKPEIVAPDCVSVTGSGGFSSTFCGTSASAPHAGAVAALLLSANPAMTPAQLQATLVAPTVHLGAPSPNVTFGFGRIDALASAQLAGNQPRLGLGVQPTEGGRLNWIVDFSYPDPPLGAPTLLADAYFGYLRPDGTLIFLGPGLTQSPGDLNDPQSCTPLFTSVEAPAGAFLPPTLAFSAPVSGPPGQYLAFFGAMPAAAGPSGNLWSLGSSSSNDGVNFQGVALVPFSRP